MSKNIENGFSSVVFCQKKNGQKNGSKQQRKQKMIIWPDTHTIMSFAYSENSKFEKKNPISAL